MSAPQISLVDDIQTSLKQSAPWDAVILLGPEQHLDAAPELATVVQQAQSVDARVGKQVLLLAASAVPGGRLISAPSGNLEHDFDDVRCYADAAKKAIEIARDAGATKPLVIVTGAQKNAYEHALAVSYFAVTQALWQPLEAREALDPLQLEPITEVGFYSTESAADPLWMQAVAEGLRAARDVCGTEPERMAPPRMAEYCQSLFGGSAVSVSVLDDMDALRRDYPLLMAVGRSSVSVERHQPRVIKAEYCPEGPIERTLLFAGKGIVFDTGGADLKVGGHMAGMSRDKGGAAAVVGFLQTLAVLKPKGIRVLAEIGAVRNSIGADAFVPDEIIRSHAGVRVRIGNTDAEGRLVMADLLSHLREKAESAVNPTLFTVATLTGHAARAVGPYTAMVDNGPAWQQGVAAELAKQGDLWGDPGEISRSRREDWQFILGKTQADDLLSCNNAASAVTPRGHQFPMAFMAVSAGLDKHNIQSNTPMPYTHIDIAGSGVEGGDWQHGKPTGTPVVALAATYLRK